MVSVKNVLLWACLTVLVDAAPANRKSSTSAAATTSTAIATSSSVAAVVSAASSAASTVSPSSSVNSSTGASSSLSGDTSQSTAKSVAQVVAPLGISVATDASKHGQCKLWGDLVNDFIQSHGLKPNLWNSWWNWIQKLIRHDILPYTTPRTSFVGWNSYKANGVNFGSWLEVEQGNTANVIPSQYPDEWTYCASVGKSVCGPVLEKHYETWYTTDDVDLMLKYGINTIRIPTTYAAWLQVPGSQLYTGNQLVHLRRITNYAVSKGIHVVIGLHSLPGGVNWLDIGEALGHLDWWYNATNLDYSLKVVDNVLAFIQTSANPNQFTLEPINEPCDDFSKFATPETVSYPNGVNYLNTYLRAVYAKIQRVNRNIPLMISDAFMGPAYWSPYWQQGQNIVIDTHLYFFAAAGVYGNYVPQITCGQASAVGTNFPVFVGEFSLQSKYNNTLASRQVIYQTQVYAYAKYLSGSAFWNGKLDVSTGVDGEGTQNDYWSFENLIKDGVVLEGGKLNATYC